MRAENLTGLSRDPACHGTTWDFTGRAHGTSGKRLRDMGPEHPANLTGLTGIPPEGIPSRETTSHEGSGSASGGESGDTRSTDIGEPDSLPALSDCGVRCDGSG
jgi:hypothetical protein